MRDCGGRKESDDGPTTDEGDACVQIVTTAHAQPERRQDGTATGSLGTVQRRLRRDGMERVGRRTIRRVVQDAGSSYQRRRLRRVRCG